MTNTKLGAVVDHLRRLVRPAPTSEGDHYLLARFLHSRDEAAFAALLGRHGPMVLGTCRRLLNQAQDAEDVVQATFLLLARKAGTIRKRTSLGCWLHRVSQRLSIQLKRREMNRQAREKKASAMRGQVESPRLDGQEIRGLLDTALQELPEKFRAAIILCYLEGLTQEEAAGQLGCPLGTVRSRLARGRNLLQKHLASRGLALSAGGLASFLTAQSASAALSTKLYGSALSAAIQYASGKALPGLVSTSVGLLVKSGLKSLALTKMLWISAGMLVLGLLAGGAGFANKYIQTVGPEPTKASQEAKAHARQDAKPPSNDVDEERPRIDRLGDPLPLGALARLGTVRLRHGHRVEKLRFSADGKTLFSADRRVVNIWEASTGRLLRHFGERPDEGGLHSSAASADHRIVALSVTGASVIDYIELFDGTTGRWLRRVPAGQHGFYPSLEISADGKILAVLVQAPQNYIDRGMKVEQSLRLFDTATGLERQRLKVSQEKIHSIVFSRDGETLVTANDDKSIRFWDTGTGKQVRQLDHSAPVGMIALAPDGKTLASVALKMTVNEIPKDVKSNSNAVDEIVLWDLVKGKETRRLKGGHKDGVVALAYSPDSKTLVSSDWNATHWWDVATGKELPSRLPSLVGVSHLDFTRDGSVLATGSMKTIQLWDVATGKQKLSQGGDQDAVRLVAISPDGRTVATATSEKLIRLWDSTSGEEIRQLIGPDEWLHSFAFALDGRTLISATVDDTVCVWELATGKELRRFRASVFGLSRDAKFLVTASNDKFMRVWETATGREVRKWQETATKHPLAGSWVAELVFSPDNKLVFSFSDDHIVRVWEVDTGKVLRQFGKDRSFYDTAFSPDGKLMAFGPQNKPITFYDLETGKESRFLERAPTPVYSVTFSSDGRVLASGDWINGTILLWELATGQKFQEFSGHKGKTNKLAFSADNKVLVSGNDDATALTWDVTGTLTGPKAKPLTAMDLETAWSDLANADATRGQKAVRGLLAVPEQAVTLLQKEMKPAKAPDPQRLARLIMDLNSDMFNTREEAMRSLEKLGDAAAPAMRQALAGSPTLELKQRLESLLEKISPSQRLRTLRAVQVLEQLGTQLSREMLARLARGASEALLTQEALAAVERLAKLRAVMP